MKTRTIRYVHKSLQEAVKSYHECLNRLEKWEEKYPQYKFEIYLMNLGINNDPTVRITISKNEQREAPKET